MEKINLDDSPVTLDLLLHPSRSPRRHGAQPGKSSFYVLPLARGAGGGAVIGHAGRQATVHRQCVQDLSVRVRKEEERLRDSRKIAKIQNGCGKPVKSNTTKAKEATDAFSSRSTAKPKSEQNADAEKEEAEEQRKTRLGAAAIDSLDKSRRIAQNDPAQAQFGSRNSGPAVEYPNRGKLVKSNTPNAKGWITSVCPGLSTEGKAGNGTLGKRTLGSGEGLGMGLVDDGADQWAHQKDKFGRITGVRSFGISQDSGLEFRIWSPSYSTVHFSEVK
ncbi:hypothetical protein K438DRAFT_1786553 [Mycena galopus ATCC 62051]|nr:hypothetical protein K438DRAFT_1786553 [Mycena galopus ATCC 62051]